MKTILEIAQIPVGINTSLNCLDEHCKAYATDRTPFFTVTTDAEDIEYERQKSIEECAYEGLPFPGYPPEELENTAVYRKIALKLPEYDALVFHGSAVAVDGKAYLFTAKSGTGKTTHTNLWLKNIRNSFIVNGDKPVLRIIDGISCVCGTPWMGKEELGCNCIVPLGGICFLSKGETNVITKAGFGAVYPKLIGQSFRPSDSAMLLKTMKLIERIGSSVPLYEMSCNMDDEAAFTSYGEMSL